MFKSTQLPLKVNAPVRPSSSNQIPGHVLSSFTHFGNPAPKQRIRANFLASPFEQYHFGNPFAGHLAPSGHFIAKQNFQNSLHMPHPGPGSYQLTSTFIASPAQKPSPEALRFIANQHFPQNNIHQQHSHHQQLPPQQPNQQSAPATQLDEPQPSYLPSLPTVPPSVLSPFFQVQQQKQETPATAAPPTSQTQNQNQPSQQQSPQTHQESSGSQFQLLNDEYTVNLVPPPPYKHTDSTRFRSRVPPPTTPSTAATSNTFTLPTGPPGISSDDFFDDEQQKALEILTKYNIPAISPLQDANRFAYNSGSFLGLSTSAAPSPAFVDNNVFRFWSGNNNNSATTFTTEKPNVFRNLNRPTESEFEQHKLMHPAYTSGTRRPVDESLAPSTTQDTSLNNAITHSFFTIEDAITLSPYHHYRRPVKPTNANEIEANLRRPTQGEEYTESASMDPFADIVKENADVVTVPPSSSTQHPRPNRNKLRRKRPRPTVDHSSSVSSTTQRSRYTPERERDENESGTSTEMPKNHKEFTATRERGSYTQFTRETTSESPRESSTGGYRNRLRTRTRLPAVTSTSTTETTDEPHRSKRPNYSAEHRRPNNRFEDTHTQRHRPQSERSTRVPADDSEQTTTSTTTVANREHSWHYGKASRRPTTTQQALSAAPTQSEDEDNEPLDVETEQYAPSLRIRSSTAAPIPTSENVIAETTQGHSEEPPVVLSTRLNVSNQPTTYTSANEDESKSTDGTEVEPADITTQYIQPSSSSTSTSTSTSTTTTSTSPSSTSEGPVYIAKTEAEPKLHHRKRMRNKDKILEAVAAATSTQTQSTRKTPANRDRGSAQQNEVVSDSDEPIATGTGEQETRLKVRLPVYKNSVKSTEEQNSTKTTRLSASGKFDPKNRPRFSIKEYRQRMSTSTTTATPDSESSSSSIASTTSSTYIRRFPTRNRLMPADLKTKLQDNRVDGERTNIVYPERSSQASVETSSEQTEVTRKRFVPKDRYSSRLKTTTTELNGESPTSSSAGTSTQYSLSSSSSSTTNKPTLRRGSTRRDFINNRVRYSTTSTTAYPTEATVSRVPTIRNSSFPLRRPQTVNLRQRIQNQKRKEILTIDDSLNDLAVEGSSDDKVSMSTTPNEAATSPIASTNSASTEDYKHETAIMKIAKDDHSYRPYKEKATTTEKMNIASTDPILTAVAGTSLSDSENDLNDSPSEQSERVAELTIFGTNQFNSVNTSGASRRIPGYFTLATEDPILPIEAFFPQVKRNKRATNGAKL